jgi:hypothetical protein
MSTMLATAGRILHRLLERNGLDADALYLEGGLDPFKLDEPRARYPFERGWCRIGTWRAPSRT